jgi:uncharacterized protein (DUF1501 family)
VASRQAACWGWCTAWAAAADQPYRRLLVLVELKGGNDGLNTVVPYADPAYYALRPRIAIRAEDVLPLGDGFGLHPALQPLLPLWQARELAIVHGLGYPEPNLSHFRSIEIWDTASGSDEYLPAGLAGAQLPDPAAAPHLSPPMRSWSAARTWAPSSAAVAWWPSRIRSSLHAWPAWRRKAAAGRHGALAHIQRVEADIVAAAAKINSSAPAFAFRSEFPQTGFGNTVRTACQVLGSGAEVAVLRLSLSGFDTHQNQPGVHANLLKQLAEGLAASAFRADRTPALGSHAGAELRRVRPAPEGEPEQWHRPRHQQRPLRPWRRGARRFPWRGAEPHPPRRRRQPGIYRRFPPPVCNGAGALVGPRIRIRAGGALPAPGIRRMIASSNPKEKPE